MPSTACGCWAPPVTTTSWRCAPSRRPSGSPDFASATRSGTPASWTPHARRRSRCRSPRSPRRRRWRASRSKPSCSSGCAPSASAAIASRPRCARPAGTCPMRRATSSGCRPVPRPWRRPRPSTRPVSSCDRSSVTASASPWASTRLWRRSYRSRHPLSELFQRTTPGGSYRRTVTPDDPALVRVLAADGRLTPTPAAEPYLAAVEALTDAELEQFYRDMVVIRAFDQQATNLQRQGQLALWPPSLGQEAAQVGSAHAARPQDHVFPAYREHVVCRIRGVDPMDIIRLMRGMTHGGWDPYDPKNGNTHLYTLVLGSQTLHATGLAMGLVFDGKCGTGDPGRDEAVIVYYGDGASS